MPEPQQPTSHIHSNQTELEKLLRRMKPWLVENATTLIYALAAVLAVAAVVVYARRAPSGNVEASRALLVARTPEDYRDVADEFPDAKIGVWARLRQADRLLDNAVKSMFSNRKLGIDELAQAETAYQRLADRTTLDEQVRERVLIGLARIAETRCDGTPASADASIAAWQRVLDEFEGSIVKDHAKSRVAALSTDECRAFYAWFHEQDPSPADVGLLPGQPSVPGVPNASALGGDSPAVPETPKADAGDAPEGDDLAKPEDAPKGDDATKPDDASKGDDATKPDDAPKGEEAAKPDDAPKGEEAAKPDDAPKGEEAAKPDDASKAEDATKPDPPAADSKLEPKADTAADGGEAQK